MQSKVCSICKQRQPLDLFYRHAGTQDGRKGRCKPCVRNHVREYGRKRYGSVEGRAKQTYFSARSRSKHRGTNFTIELYQVHALIAAGFCPKSGIKYDLSEPNGTKVNPFAPAIDRRNPQRGYEPDNIQIVCNMFNMGKSDHQEIDFIAMCCAVAERYRDTPAIIQRLKELRNAEF